MDYYKIFSLLFILFLIYKLYQCYTVSENFENNSTTLIDDWNAINQLAQLSKRLMDGGLTIPGNLRVAGNLTLASGDSKNTWNINCTGDYLRFNNGKDDVFTLGKGGGDAYFPTIFANTSYFGNGPSAVQIGQGYSATGACVYGLRNDLQIGAATGKTIVNGNLNVVDNLVVGGRNVGSLLDNLQAKISNLESQINSNTIKPNDVIKLTVADIGNSLSVSGGARFLSACGAASCGGIAATVTNDAGRHLPFIITR